jgi:aldose sugar dehydrogenase
MADGVWGMRSCFALLFLAACQDQPNTGQHGPAADAGEPAYETFVSGLAVPWAIVFASNDRIFVTERAGRIRVIEGGQLQPEPWAQVDVIAEGEAGLMGMALSPGFATDHHLYVVGTVLVNGKLVNRVIRFTEQDGRGAQPEVLIDNIPAAEFHAGDAIAFGPDGMLYIATGDAGDPRHAANLTSLAGKILRYTPDGGIPADNPSPNSPVYAFGVRNVQGLAWHPTSKHLFATDHGPSGFPNERFRRNNDELNIILPGRNYGWPEVAGNERSEQSIPPIAVWNPGIAPSGLAIYNGPIQAWRNSIFIGGLRGQQLRRVVVDPDSSKTVGYRVVRDDALFHEKLGRIRAVVMGPDGYLYFATSNWDGRGDPGSQDDRILRLIPGR